MYKVIIDSKGIIRNISDNKPLGMVVNSRDIPSTSTPAFRKLRVKLLSGAPAFLYYGGYISNKFTIACGITCNWGKNCIRYAKDNCIHNPKYSDTLGYYLSETKLD